MWYTDNVGDRGYLYFYNRYIICTRNKGISSDMIRKKMIPVSIIHNALLQSIGKTTDWKKMVC